MLETRDRSSNISDSGFIIIRLLEKFDFYQLVGLLPVLQNSLSEHALERQPLNESSR